MPLGWTEWQDDPGADKRTPYSEWYAEHEGKPLIDAGLLRLMPQEVAGTGARDALGPLPEMPVLSRSLPPGVMVVGEGIGPRSGPPDLSCSVPRDALIVGVIDSGIALAQDRLRRSGGIGTRILSAWMQTATPPSGAARQAHMPFGRDLSQAAIDAAMNDCRRPDGVVDEDRFDCLIGSVDLQGPLSDNPTLHRATHGSLVADLAAGADPHGPTADSAPPLIVVNLPPVALIGPSGNALESYVIWAIRYIVETADAIWTVQFGEETPGFPLVINLSYGLQAGPKDGRMRVQRYIAALVEERSALRRAPLVFVLPAGNDNQSRGAAHLDLPTGEDGSLTWRIPPEDRTSSYAEVWTEVIAEPEKMADHAVDIGLDWPGGPPQQLSMGRPGQRRDLRDTAGQIVARIWCRETGSLGGDRRCYTLAVAPSWARGGVSSPAGGWTIRVRAPKGHPAKVLLYTQTDQGLTASGSDGLASWFDHPDYRTHDAAGRRVTTDEEIGGASEGPVSRKNTLNAMAGSLGIVTVGGSRGSDGWPVDFSSSGRGFTRGAGAAYPDLAAVADEAPHLLGRLGAGPRSGSAVILQGTSFACAEATRAISAALARPDLMSKFETDSWPGFIDGVFATLDPRPLDSEGVDDKLTLGRYRVPMARADQRPGRG